VGIRGTGHETALRHGRRRRAHQARLERERARAGPARAARYGVPHRARAHRRWPQRDRITLDQSQELFEYADQCLRDHGAPYRRIRNGFHFEWVGDPAQHAQTVQPALLALADPRLRGAQAEFEEALAKRRRGAPKDLEDAVDEAAKSVESILKILHREHTIKPPATQQITQLFNSLVAAQILPGYIDKLIAAPAGPRNHMASHGQGSAVREVPAELADASIAAAATAITLLAHYLP
jgi:HEPN domain-containing protein